MPSETLVESDVRAVVRLLGEVAAMSEPVQKRKSRLMHGLCSLVDADVWFWTVTQITPAGEYTGLNILHHGLDERQLAAYFEISYASDYVLHEGRALMELAAAGVPFTRRRQQLLSDEQWYATDYARMAQEMVDVEQSLYSFYPVQPGLWSCTGIHRRWGRPPLTERDARLVHIVMSEVDAIHRAGVPGAERKSNRCLPRRLRTVFGLLLEGHSRCQIAAHSGLSPYTVRDYMSEIYRHFDVSSQVELIRRFSAGDGGDQAFA